MSIRIGTGPQRARQTATGRLLPGDPAALLRRPAGVDSPVLRVILELTRNGSRPRDRNEEHVVCLAIEGGGMRGAISAGMCVVLEAMGLIAAFDRIYGVSAGRDERLRYRGRAGALSAAHSQDAARQGVIKRTRPLLRRPIVDFDRLFNDVISSRMPLSSDALASGPEFRALATSFETLSLRVLQDFADIDDAMQAVRGKRGFAVAGRAATHLSRRANGRWGAHRADSVRDSASRGSDTRAGSPLTPSRLSQPSAPRARRHHPAPCLTCACPALERYGAHVQLSGRRARAPNRDT